MASCNSLLLCCAETEACPTIYYICNPLTKQWFALPPLYHRRKEACTGLICENNSDQYGFRVVCIVNESFFKAATVKIFSSETGKWTETIHSYQLQNSSRWIDILNKKAIVCEGMLYWSSRYGGGFITCDRNGNLTFSLDYYPAGFTQRFKRKGVCAGVCMGRFCLGQLSSEYENPNDFALLRVWQLEERDSGKWCLKHEFRMNELKSEVLNLLNMQTPLM